MWLYARLQVTRSGIVHPSATVKLVSPHPFRGKQQPHRPHFVALYGKYVLLTREDFQSLKLCVMVCI